VTCKETTPVLSVLRFAARASVWRSTPAPARPLGNVKATGALGAGFLKTSKTSTVRGLSNVLVTSFFCSFGLMVMKNGGPGMVLSWKVTLFADRAVAVTV